MTILQLYFQAPTPSSREDLKILTSPLEYFIETFNVYKCPKTVFMTSPSPPLLWDIRILSNISSDRVWGGGVSPSFSFFPAPHHSNPSPVDPSSPMSWIPCSLLAPKLLPTGLCLQPLTLTHRNTCLPEFSFETSPAHSQSPHVACRAHSNSSPRIPPLWVPAMYPAFRKVSLQLTPPSSKVTSPVKPAWGLRPAPCLSSSLISA